LPAEYFSAMGHVDYGSKFKPDKTAVMRYSLPGRFGRPFWLRYSKTDKCFEINTLHVPQTG
jgi:hypothetical protein